MRKTAIGWQSFEAMRNLDIFYVDKTGFIRELWENRDAVTLITRPRRFGKTLNLEETVANALAQIEDKHYEASLIADGIEPEKIRKYGFAFEGKTVLVG